MKTFHFRVDLRCHLANGEISVVRGYRVPVQADSQTKARKALKEVATEMVHDAGGEVTDAPLDYLELIRVVAL